MIDSFHLKDRQKLERKKNIWPDCDKIREEKKEPGEGVSIHHNFTNLGKLPKVQIISITKPNKKGIFLNLPDQKKSFCFIKVVLQLISNSIW